MKLKFTLFSLLLLIGLCISGCSTTSYNGFYNGYNQAYTNNVDFEEHKIPRDEHTLIAREYNPKNQGKYPTIILLHGFPDSSHLYDLLVPHIKHRRHVVTFDFLGWGRSDKPENHVYNTKSLYKDLEAVIRYFNVEKVELAAHDLSGFPVIDWALDNEQRIDSLILFNSVYFPSEKLLPPEAIARFSEDSIYRDISAWAVKQFDTPWKNGHEEQVNKFFCNEDTAKTFVKIFNHQSMNIQQAFLEMNRFLTDEVNQRREMLPKMKVFSKPVKIIFGAEDPYLNAEVAKEFHSLFPNSELHLIKSACHFVQLDKPEEVANIILKSDTIE
ncbi:MAG: alpha/beta hydrolase [Kangiellaceae bacterium]|nr:alpha/beta hydrolase [Kangiellaceae bacterium]